jgi:hypothetical protein
MGVVKDVVMFSVVAVSVPNNLPTKINDPCLPDAVSVRASVTA